MSVKTVQQLLNTAIEAHRRGDIHTAIGQYQRVISVAPKNSAAVQLLGTCHLQLGNYENARGLLESAIALDPNYADAFHNLARLGEAEHDLVAAEKHYKRAHALAPSNADTTFSLANVLKEKGSIDESEEFYRKTLEPSPGYAPAHRQLARLIDHDTPDDETFWPCRI